MPLSGTGRIPQTCGASRAEIWEGRRSPESSRDRGHACKMSGWVKFSHVLLRLTVSRFSRDQSRGDSDLFATFNVHFWMISRRRKLSSSAMRGSNKQDGSINRLRCPPVSLPLLLLLGSLMGRELLLRRGLRCQLICSNSAVISIKAARPFFLPPSY